ncbi:hypothetical protein MMC29_001757 [Sticta canariensis]|nr:hypothetical protein [Sticta canariensis]
MSAFESLPDRPTVRIVKEIGSTKLSRFDTVAAGDLQNLRLVSTRFNIVVTPILFQSLIWDQRFLRPKDIHRIVKFVSLFPHLSRYVQDLLIRVPPDNTASAIDDLEETRAFLRVTGVSEAKGLTEVHEGIYHQLMVAPLQLWKNLAEDDVAIADRGIRQVYWETFQRLPNLRHIETAVSTHYYECLATASDIVARELKVFVENYTHNALFSEGTALTSTYALILSSCPPHVESLKFRQLPLMENVPEWCPIPSHIHNLEIEFRIPADYLTDGEGQRLLGEAVKEWREQLRSLPLLRSLYLDFCGSWDQVNQLPLLDETPLYIHALLPCLSHDIDNSVGTHGSSETPRNRSNGPAFPNLTAFTLRNVPADPFALLDFIAAHQSSLRRLVLHRISLDIGWNTDWAQVGTMLAECVPDLAYLELWRIGTHCVGWYNKEGKMVEEDDDDDEGTLQRMIAHQLLDEDEIDVVYERAGWGEEDGFEEDE